MSAQPPSDKLGQRDSKKEEVRTMSTPPFMDMTRQTRRAQPRPRGAGRRLSFAVAYDLWLSTWGTALSALARATESGTLSANEAAARKAVIAAEREVVTRQFTLLVEHQLNRLSARDDVSFVADETYGRQRVIAVIDGASTRPLTTNSGVYRP